MIQPGTIVQIQDNTGARTARCIKVLKRRKPAGLGGTIVVSIQKSTPTRKIRPGRVHHASIIQTKAASHYVDGGKVRLRQNRVFLLNAKGQPLGNRITCPVIFHLGGSKVKPHRLKTPN